MCGECGFEVEEVGWNIWVRSRGLVEPAGLRRIFAVRVKIRRMKIPSPGTVLAGEQRVWQARPKGSGVL